MTIITMIIILAAAITAAADSRQLAAATADNPIPLKLNRRVHAHRLHPQLISMYGIDHTGALIQTAEYYSTGTSIAIRSLLPTPRAYRVVQSLDNHMAIITSNHGYSNPYIGIQSWPHNRRWINPPPAPDRPRADPYLYNHHRRVQNYRPGSHHPGAGAARLRDHPRSLPRWPRLPRATPAPIPMRSLPGRGTIAQKKAPLQSAKKCPACDGTRRTILPTLHRITL